MYKEGDYISYPMHGAGKIEAVEEKCLNDETRLYYVLYFYSEGMRIIVPVEKALSIGMRPIMDKMDAEEVFLELAQLPGEEDSNWNRRYRANLDKLRTSEPTSIAHVIKSLSLREEKKRLSAGEKKMLVTARRLLIGEMYIANVGTEEYIEQRIDECLRYLSEGASQDKIAMS